MAQTDQQALALTHAIALAESGHNGVPNYEAVGDNGTSHGAYQWQPGNFESAAKEAGLDPRDRSPMNQDKVAYHQVKKFKDEGLDPGQIASKWNSGSPNNWHDHAGTTIINGKPISYDTPAYVKRVQGHYQQLVSQSGIQSSPDGLPAAPYIPPQQNTQMPIAPPEPQQTNLGTDLSGKLNEATTAISDAATNFSQGKIHQGASGLFQAVGAGAGAVGDVLNRGLELIPGVKQVEGLIGQGAGALAQTDSGKSVIASIKDFSQRNPELAKDIGAGFNIVTAIPILRGLGIAKNIAMDGVSSALKGVAEKSAKNGFESVVNSTRTGSQAFARSPKSVDVLIRERAIPDIEAGKYTTTEASAKLDHLISHIDDHELAPALAKEAQANVSSPIPFDSVVKYAEAQATLAQEDFAPILKELELVRKKYGDYPTLAQLNEAKRTVSHKISQAAYGSLDSSAMKVTRSVLQQTVEEGAKALGLQDVGAINAKMSELIRAQNLLKYIDKKSVRTGLLGGAMKDAATVGGEMAGNATGIPLAGAYIGRETGGRVAKKVLGVRNGILNRTGKDAQRVTAGKAKKRAVGLLVGAMAQRTTESR